MNCWLSTTSVLKRPQEISESNSINAKFEEYVRTPVLLMSYPKAYYSLRAPKRWLFKTKTKSDEKTTPLCKCLRSICKRN